MQEINQRGDDSSVYCASKACFQSGQLVYDIFPEDCEASDWFFEDSEDGTAIPMTKMHFAAQAKNECNWDFETRQ